MNKMLIVLIVLFMPIAIFGCESSNQADEELIKEIQSMQQRIDELEREVKRVDTKQDTQIVIEEPMVFTCSVCSGFGNIKCGYCRGTGNSKSVCNVCNGSGLNGGIACFRCGGSGFGICPFCLGYGHVTCNNCGGTGTD